MNKYQRVAYGIGIAVLSGAYGAHDLTFMILGGALIGLGAVGTEGER